ncbi:nucleotidyltransferase family protein [Thermogemmatispora onikobensis]|uniref:nucleotidyltransferase family protein n=1 Tax=Thermogemmatispora onikobensis TaxID=732234 RepID=UPI0009FEE44C|nr:nucleotidyltransferase family protein [Thermogemmatispora onikobensis]
MTRPGDFEAGLPASAEAGSANGPGPTLADGVAEAQRLVTALQQEGLTLRLLGGLAVRLRCPSARHRSLARSYADLDFVAPKKQARPLRVALEANGYVADRRFNALHGERRLLFYDQVHQRQIDIFLSVFEMCHKLVLEPRLQLHPLTLSPADLLLTKLQIVELNAKDIQDLLALLLDFPPQETAANPGEQLDMRIVTQVCAHDWGWYTTVTDNLQRVAQEADQLLQAEEAARVRRHIEEMLRLLDQAPKSSAWKLRALVGRRLQWYELPEEVHR